METAKSGRKAFLVSHRPVSTMSARQNKLFRELKQLFPDQFIHVPVWINKRQGLGKEPTQRTRSFLFAALGTVVAHSIKARGVRFFENGVVSLNLPMADEVLRSRASRTTHPITLHLLQSLCAAVVGGDFAVDNPYCFKTKTEVVQIISRCGLAEQQRFSQMQMLQAQARDQALARAVEDGNAELAKKYSFWADPQQRQEVQTAIVEWALNNGYSKDELRGLSSPKYLETMMKASAYDRMIAGSRTTAPNLTVRTAPPRGAAPPPRPVEQVQSAQQEFDNKPTWQNGAALLTAQRNAASNRGNGHTNW